MGSYKSTFLQEAFYLIENEKAKQLKILMERNCDKSISFNQFTEFVDMFCQREKSILRKCININGTGGSGIRKFNLTSISSIYVAAISKLNIVKTGSFANTGECGSSDFFNSIGLLTLPNKIDALHDFHFAYYDYLELSPWKKYKTELSLNHDISKLLNNCIFFDYKSQKQLLGISNERYAKSIYTFQSHCFPDKIDFFYSYYHGICIDEVWGGDVYLNGKKIAILPYITVGNLSKEEIIAQGMDLLFGQSNNENWVEYLAYSVAIYLIALEVVTTVDEGLQIFQAAYLDKKAKSLIENIKNCKD